MHKIKTARNFCLGLATLSLLCGCTNAAKLGDGTLRKASFGRVQATPFMDFVNTEACRDSLTQAIGFTHKTQTVTRGVQIVQVFECEADRVIAHVTLKNLNAYTMQCIARTEEGEFAAIVEPYGFARFDYAFRQSSSHACAEIG
jgi:hypothetical protein